MLEKVVKVVNGHPYTFWITPVQKIVEELLNIKNEDYSYKAKEDITCSEIFVEFNNMELKETRSIGKLVYNLETDIITYTKFLKKSHEYIKTSSMGLAWDVVNNLRSKDKIKLHFDDCILDISVYKFMKFMEFKHYKSKGFEKQVMCGIEHFKRSKNNYKKTIKKHLTIQ